MKRTSRNSKIIKANKEKIYKAFTEKQALEFWLAPDNMTGKIDDFELKVGGGYKMSLSYNDPNTKGKSSGNEDRFSAKFVELQPHEKIVKSISFESDEKAFFGEMIMEISLEEVDDNSTRVTIIFRNIPHGIDPKDNETGTAQSLKKLALYVEKS